MLAKELVQRIKAKKAPCIIDVRSGGEYSGGHIPGSLHAPTWKILFKMAPLPTNKNIELVITCEMGPRAQLAQAVLGMYGYRNVTLLEGHMSGWRQASLPMNKTA